MNGPIRWLSNLLLLGLIGVSLQAASPDLSYAPPPKLSAAAWKELQGKHAEQKTVTLTAKITVTKGAVTDVTAKDATQWPQAAAEVQAWIKQNWKFVRSFSGTAVQPVSFKLVEKPPNPTSTLAPNPSSVVASSLLVESPKPRFPFEYREAIRDYKEKHNNLMPGVLLSVGVQNGAITDVRVIDQYGPAELGTYAVDWVRQHWVFKPNATGTVRIPLYYDYTPLNYVPTYQW